MFDRDHFVNKKKMVYAGIFNNLFILENFFEAKITSSLENLKLTKFSFAVN
jgi:hypothetical protein